jgi:hypothetical protein
MKKSGPKKSQGGESELQPPKKVVADVTPDRTRVVVRKKAKQKSSEIWQPENRKGTISGLRAGLLDAAVSKFGMARVFGDAEEMKRLIVGVPTPSLAFEYLIDRQVLPLRSMLMLAGSWSTNKSSLLYELMRWFIELDGLACITDTELKFDAALANSVMRCHDSPQYIYTRAASLEQAQASISFQAKKMLDLMKGSAEEPGPGLQVPCILGLDSLAAGTSQENIETVATLGHATRSFPLDALLNKGFSQGIRPTLMEGPFLLAIVNHLKTKADKSGNEIEYSPGGRDQNFMESLEIRTVVWKTSMTTANWSGKGIRLRVAKNSFGAPNRSIRTRFLWWTELNEASGKRERRHAWDWDWSIVDLLSGAEGPLKAALKEHGLTVKATSPAADVGCMASMKALGISEKSPVPWSELGRLLNTDEAIKNQLREAMDIQPGALLDRPIPEMEKMHLGKKKAKR